MFYYCHHCHETYTLVGTISERPAVLPTMQNVLYRTIPLGGEAFVYRKLQFTSQIVVMHVIYTHRYVICGASTYRCYL